MTHSTILTPEASKQGMLLSEERAGILSRVHPGGVRHSMSTTSKGCLEDEVNEHEIGLAVLSAGEDGVALACSLAVTECDSGDHHR